MKIKLETSPWKNHIKTIDDYIDTVKERLDITLEKDKMSQKMAQKLSKLVVY
jgi:hypothetical protein